MQYRSFKGYQCSLLGFGCMRFPTGADGKIDRQQAYALLERAYASGVNYYDTAYPYHNQESEAVLGLWQRTKHRDSLLLATKLPVWEVTSQEQARLLFQEQLAKLRTDYIDFYLLHGLDAQRWKKVQELGLLDLLDDLKMNGHILRLGFSFHDDYPVFKEILLSRKWDFCQLQLNYMDTHIQAGMQGAMLAGAKQVPIMIMEPVKGGALANPPDEVRARFQELHPDWSGASWALRWAANLEGVAVVLSGMSTMEQLRENLATFSDMRPLNPQEEKALEFAAAQYRARIRVPCTGCRYCLPCPQGVEIPSIFNLYNKACVYDNQAEASRRTYADLDLKATAAACVGCGKCAALCPQSIEIPARLAEAGAFLGAKDPVGAAE